VDGLEPGYNHATATAARLRVVAFSKNKDASRTAQLPAPVDPDVMAPPPAKAKAAAGVELDPSANGTSLVVAEEQEIMRFAKLLARVIRRDGSFAADIRGVDDTELAHVRDILNRFYDTIDVARAAIDAEMTYRAIAETVLKEHPDFACPISHALMRDPVVAADGHSYERWEIESHFSCGSRKSPIDGDNLSGTALIPNRNLKKEIERGMAVALGESTDNGGSGGVSGSGGSGGSKEVMPPPKRPRP
jgi:hypothetical protein